MKKQTLVLMLIALVLVSTLVSGQTSTPAPFALRDGDRVVFFGDSITEQRLYTRFVEQYVLTRFPDRKVTFINAGVGGDKVSGGWTGPIDLRLRRDLFAYDPTVITIMLGMNDGYYRAPDQEVLATFEEGYRQMLQKIAAKAPQARLTLIKPSAFDDVTRPPQFQVGYNAVLVQMGALIDKMAAERRALVADMNTPVVATLTTAKQLDPALAVTLMVDRIHPGAGVHWVMAAALLKGWNAPAVVSAASIDAARLSATETMNTELTQIRKSKTGVITWTQIDRALPLPFPAKASDPVVHLALAASRLVDELDQETLRLGNLRPGNYELRIDDRLIGTFTDAQLSAGLNLALMETPMLAQSRLVALDNDCKNGLEATRFQLVRSPLDFPTEEAAAKLDRAVLDADAQQRADAQPLPHRFSVAPVGNAPRTASAK